MNPQADILPTFEVEELEGTETVVRNVRQEDGTFKQVEEEVPMGWMVYFPAGHSIRVRKEREMMRLGFMENPELIDMESGETVASAQTSLKERNERKTKPSRRKKRSPKKAAAAATSGVMRDE